MLEKGFKPCEEVFNHIMKFSVKPFEFLQKMNELGIQPSVHTFNVAIKAIAFEEKVNYVYRKSEKGLWKKKDKKKKCHQKKILKRMSL